MKPTKHLYQNSQDSNWMATDWDSDAMLLKKKRGMIMDNE